MGYTHYWHNPTKLSPAFVEAVQKVIDAAPVKLLREYDEPQSKPEVTTDRIFLNGEGDDGHETFVFEPGSDFDFCKTNAKPYDVVVTAILSLVAHFGLASEVSSDGGAEDWEEGVKLAREATGLDVQCPV
jgi:hypothetical protein